MSPVAAYRRHCARHTRVDAYACYMLCYVITRFRRLRYVCPSPPTPLPPPPSFTPRLQIYAMFDAIRLSLFELPIGCVIFTIAPVCLDTFHMLRLLIAYARHVARDYARYAFATARDAAARTLARRGRCDERMLTR